MIRLTQTRAPSSICMRDAYCRAVMELARKNPAIVSVEADVCSSMGMEPFRQEFPERSINCGIQEANAVTMASGMSLMGMIPTFNAFATFASRRVYDQVVISCGFAGANVKIFGGDAGITAASNGGTHMAMEDVSIMVAVPGMTVVEPADPVALARRGARNCLTSTATCICAVRASWCLRFTKREPILQWVRPTCCARAQT